MKKKALSILLTLAMLLSLVPAFSIGAAAATIEVANEDSLVSAVSNGGGIKLAANIRLSSPLAIASGKTVTLDLNGYVLSGTGCKIIDNSGTLTIKDSGTTAEHYFTYYTDGSEWTYIASPDAAQQATTYTVDNVYTASENVTVKVLGGCITGTNSNVACISSGGTFTLNGGNIVGNYSYGYYGGGVANTGTFTMNGGSIIGNKLNDSRGGGGVVNIGTFTMNAGNISYNYGRGAGGGVLVTNYGTEVSSASFTMNGGSITHNISRYGGGVAVDVHYEKTITFKMTGGTISNNTSTEDGGGIYNERGKLTVSGGSINDNTAAENGGGIYNRFGTLTISGGSINNNAAASNGGGIYNYCGALTVRGGSIKNNSAVASGGGIYTLTDIDHIVDISNGTVIENNSAKNGGGIYNKRANGEPGEGKMKITGCTIAGNKANVDENNSYGGGIYNNQGELTVSSSSIESNTATNSGGGINNYYGTLTVTNTTVKNSSANYGGGIYNNSGTLTVSGGSIKNNEAAYSGGGIYTWIDSDHTAAISNGTVIEENTARYGGGIYNSAQFVGGNLIPDTGKLTITSCTIVSNKATGATYTYEDTEYPDSDGGGIYNNSATLTIIGGSIENNEATSSGGGINNYYGTLSVTNASIKNNNTLRGGGIFNCGGMLTVSDGSIENNEGTYSGGGIYTWTYTDNTATISNGTVIKENTSEYGGGICNDGGMLAISGGNITDNTAIYCGGGVYTWTDANHSVTISDGAAIKENSAKYGGGIYNSAQYSYGNPIASAGNLTITNCSVVENEATGAIYGGRPDSWGGGIYNDSGMLTISGGKINNNTSSRGGAGIYTYTYEDGSTMSITGTEIKGNSGFSGSGLYNEGTTTLSNSTISENVAVWGAAICNCSKLTIEDSAVKNNTITATGDWKEDFGGAGMEWWDGSLTLSGNRR